MIPAPIQFDVPTISLAEVMQREAAAHAAHLARLAEISTLAFECKKSARICHRHPEPGNTKRKRKSYRFRPTRIWCVELKYEFSSVYKATKFLTAKCKRSFDNNQITRAAKAGWACGGFHWKVRG